MRALFLGTPETAVPFLKALAKRTEVVAVISQPDRPAGRGLAVESTPVKVAARKLGLTLFQPEKPSLLRSELGGLRPEIAVVVAYGKILKPDLLAVPKL